jgi:hypothetical protein
LPLWENFGFSFHDSAEHSFATKWDIYIYGVRATALGFANYPSMTFVPSVGYGPTIEENMPYPLLRDNEERRTYFLTAGAPPIVPLRLVSVDAKGAPAESVHEYESVYPGLRIIDDTSSYRLTIEAARR